MVPVQATSLGLSKQFVRRRSPMKGRTLTPRTLAPLFVLLLFAAWIAAQVTTVNRSQPGSPTVNVLYKFPYDGTPPNGYSHGKVVYSELIQGADGNFYGTLIIDIARDFAIVAVELLVLITIGWCLSRKSAGDK
jgi:hypothetical protein